MEGRVGSDRVSLIRAVRYDMSDLFPTAPGCDKFLRRSKLRRLAKHEEKVAIWISAKLHACRAYCAAQWLLDAQMHMRHLIYS